MRNTAKSEIEKYLKSVNIKNLEDFHAKALVDTGATSCAITKKLIDKLNLVPVGSALQATASDIRKSNIYLIGLNIPVKENKVIYYKMFFISVMDLPDIGKPHDFDIIIGMDILRTMIFQYQPNKLTIAF